MATQEQIERLREVARRIRVGIIDLVGVGRPGHLGGSYSLADMMAALYFYRMTYDPQNPKWDGRDRLILSKGHSALCQYAALAELGVIDRAEFARVKVLGAILQGHPDMTKCPGIEAIRVRWGRGFRFRWAWRWACGWTACPAASTVCWATANWRKARCGRPPWPRRVSGWVA